jgi:hypothetical protein
MAKTKDITRVQDQILGQFKRDAKSSTANSATAQAIKAGLKAKAYREQKLKELEQKPRMSINALIKGY